MKEREKTTLSGNGLSRGRVRRKHFAKRGMAYFLTFLMLMGSVQTVTYAEENAKEIAGHLELGEEKPSLEETEALVKTEERTDRPEEAVTSETTVSSDHDRRVGRGIFFKGDRRKGQDRALFVGRRE